MNIPDIIITLILVGFGSFVAFLVFLFHASRQAHDNPLRIVMGSIASRIAVTLGIGLLDIPIATVEPVGGIVDVASLGFLAYYWFTGMRQAIAAFDPPKSLPRA